MQINKKMDIHVELGNNDNHHQFLAHAEIVATSDKSKIQDFMQQSKITQDYGEDPGLVFHFYVEPGKEKQVVQYFNDVLQEKNNSQQWSPLQKPFRKPSESRGKVEVVQDEGLVIVRYRFWGEDLKSQGDIQQIQQHFVQFQTFTFHSELTLKGQIKHNSQNRTNVKVDYADYKLNSDQISPSDYQKLTKVFGFSEEDMEFLTKVPAYNMLGNLKRANFDVKLASFRQIKDFYNKASGEKLEKQDKPFPYVNKGLFRKQVKVFFFYKKIVGWRAQAQYNGQDVFMRLLKVNHVFFSKMFD